MITYDGLRVLMMAEDDSRCCFWPIRASIPTKNNENKTVCVVFHCAFDGRAKIRQNMT